MTIDVGDTPATAKALLVRGRASVDIVNGVADEYIAASTKFERQVRSMYDQMARISIKPVWARFFDFGAGGMRDSYRRWRAMPSSQHEPSRRC
jgi:hypothetical protein